MKSFFSFLMGICVGAAGYWFLAEGRTRNTVHEAKTTVTEGADRIKESIKDTVGEIRTDEIKQELERSGRVVRQKAKKVGEAMATAADNARITATIKAKLIAEPQLSALSINVDTTDGLVTLSGSVGSHEQIARAMQLALATDGVREVVATLQVKPGK